jgi:hypothetical protein
MRGGGGSSSSSSSSVTYVRYGVAPAVCNPHAAALGEKQRHLQQAVT